MYFPRSQPGRRTNEDVFFDYHPQLLAWGAQITQNDREEAEDLVQDCYLCVTRIGRQLDGMEHLDRYLFRVLRNLYYARLRRGRREPIDKLSIVDFDTVEQGLAAADRRELLFVRSRLEQICRYACERKSANRSAGILIMRFFLGYFPGELIRIVNVPRYVVDQALYVVRSEARAWLERPGSVVSILDGKSEGKHAPAPLITSSLLFDDSESLFRKLRKLIFNAKEGECFEREALGRRYSDDAAPTPMSAQELAHLVSCPACLDLVNSILDLPLLAERTPENGLDRDGSSRPRSGTGSGKKGGAGTGNGARSDRASSGRSKRNAAKEGPSIQKMERRARELYEHRPQILEIVVDGDVRSSQKVTSEFNEFRATLGRKEEPSFIEVLSEQGFRVAFLLVDAPVSADKLEQVESVELSDGRSLVLELKFGVEGAVIQVLYRDPVMASVLMEEMPVETGGSRGRRKSLAQAATELAPVHPLNRLRRWAGVVPAWAKDRVKSWLKRLRLPTMTPLLTTGIVCAVFSIVFLVLAYRSTSVMNPADMLKRSATAELAPLRSGASGVIVETVCIKTSRQKLERTLYRDIQGKRRLRSQKLSQQEAALQSDLEQLGIPWNDPLSAGSYRDWHDRAAVKQDVVRRPEKGFLTLITTVEKGRIASESLTVRESDLHPLVRTVELRDAGTIEIAEVNYGVLPWSSVNSDLFEPDFNAASPIVGDARASVLPRLHRALTPVELDEAELGARLVLNRLHLDGNDRIELVRQPAGVRVQGVVEDTQEKRQLQEQLYSVPYVSVAVLTIQEMAAQPTAASEVASIQQSSASAASAPSALEKYLAQRGVDRIAAGASVQEILLTSFAVKRESDQILDLMRRFAGSQSLSIAARAELSELLVQHKAALLAALGQEDKQLASLQLIPSTVAGGSANGGETRDDVDALVGIAKRNFDLCAELVSESNPSPRPAEQIAPQVAESIARLRATVLHVSAADELSPPPGTPLTANQNR